MSSRSGVRAVRILLQERRERRPRFVQLPFLPQFRGGLEVRQADVDARFIGNLPALLRAHGELRLHDHVITKERRAAENHDGKQEREEPLNH
jgi:hypothetical protein